MDAVKAFEKKRDIPYRMPPNRKLGSVLCVNHWDGESDTEIAVKPIKTFTPKKSTPIVNEYSAEKEVKADLRKNGRFYRAFNEWIDRVRRSSQN